VPPQQALLEQALPVRVVPEQALPVEVAPERVRVPPPVMVPEQLVLERASSPLVLPGLVPPGQHSPGRASQPLLLRRSGVPSPRA
jgi:hypothetical protein